MRLDRDLVVRAARVVRDIDALFGESMTATDARVLAEVIAAALPTRPADAGYDPVACTASEALDSGCTESGRPERRGA